MLNCFMQSVGKLYIIWFFAYLFVTLQVENIYLTHYDKKIFTIITLCELSARCLG